MSMRFGNAARGARMMSDGTRETWTRALGFSPRIGPHTVLPRGWNCYPHLKSDRLPKDFSDLVDRRGRQKVLVLANLHGLLLGQCLEGRCRYLVAVARHPRTLPE